MPRRKTPDASARMLRWKASTPYHSTASSGPAGRESPDESPPHQGPGRNLSPPAVSYLCSGLPVVDELADTRRLPELVRPRRVGADIVVEERAVGRIGGRVRQ